ncbi:MAG: IS1595 family transposase [Acidobacteriia bacterium]|nr:IS1595 family transposase [Terriglobia bacterium]
MNIISIYKKFPTETDCIAHIENVRWRGIPTCPYCKATRTTPIKSEQRHHCNSCNTTFSVTVDTIFHHTHLPLQKWFLAISLVLNAKKGLSARQLARDLEVNKNTGWYMGMRIRNAMFEQGELLKGIVEMDETYIGPRKPRRGNKKQEFQAPLKRGRGTNKQPVVGMIERGGRIIAKPVHKDKLGSKSMAKLVRENIDVSDAMLITDEWSGYIKIRSFMRHETINHQVCYVNGEIHTNTIESFWGLLKRGIVGQYHKVTLRHLHQYITAFCYRFNHRKNPDVFNLTIARALGVVANG